MLNLNGRTLLLGGFHDHWSRWDDRNPSLLLAALNYYHYDFVTLMCGPDTDSAHRAAAEMLGTGIKIYPGREEFFGWGHVVTVNPTAPRMEGDDPDYERTLRKLKETSDLVILAHPNYPGTWEDIYQTGEMDRLMDEGAIDGVNLINTNGFEVPSHKELIAWFEKRDAAGRHTPIVGGWDAHMVVPRPNLPPVLYSREHPPRGHIDTCGSNRTILFCEENSLPAIVEAVRDGRTVIEDIATGGLVGPASLVQFLRENSYAETIRELDAERDNCTLTVPVPWQAGKPAVLKNPGPGSVTIGVPTINGLELAETVMRDDETDVLWPAAPGVRDKDYATVIYKPEGGTERIRAIETRHPVQLEVLPKFDSGRPGLEIKPLVPFEGEVSVRVDAGFQWSGPVTETTRLALPSGLTNEVTSSEWGAVDKHGFAKSEKTEFTFLTAPAFKGSWEAIPAFAVDSAHFVPGFAYGAKRPYPGPDVFACYYQFAWDDEAFHWRARIQDEVHFQPCTEGQYLYNADCLQLAIDPLLRRDESIGHVHTFNLALTSDGPMLHRWLAPDQKLNPDFTVPPGDTTLDRSYLNISPWQHGLIYEMRLPWSELAPAKPAPGSRLGLYTIAFNNDGDGLLDTLHWPVPLDGMWLAPKKWGVLSLV